MHTKSLSSTSLAAEKGTSTTLTTAFQSTLLLFFTLFPLTYMYLFLHEGGHALVHLILGGEVDVFYAHPFALDGYVRPILFWDNVWSHAAGNGVEILISLLIFLLVWKRRSLTTLPLVLLFPWCAIRSGIGIINLAMNTGDYSNIVQLTGMPFTIFYALDVVLIIVGFFFFISLLPLLGLAPEQHKSLYVIPVSLFLWGLVGVVVAYLVVPGSRIDIQYEMGDLLLKSVKIYPILGAFLGALLALIYVTLYRRVYQRFPDGLRTETVRLTWGDLRVPALLFIICVVVGIYAIR